MGAPLGTGIGYWGADNRTCSICAARDDEIKRLQVDLADARLALRVHSSLEPFGLSDEQKVSIARALKAAKAAGGENEAQESI